MNGTTKVVVTPCGKHFIHIASDHPEFPEVILTEGQQRSLHKLAVCMAALSAILDSKGRRFPPGEYLLEEQDGRPAIKLPFDPESEGLV